MSTSDLVVTLTVAQLKDVIKDSIQNNPQKQDPVQSDLMTRYEVMQYFNISAPTIQRWVKKGTLNKIKVGRKVFFRRSEITNR
jgi:excisionase family DNA binding protein|tara:strand:+ start:267 stop:515 length:249 start_codon:yes stop_codon:yes gene_type:complete